MPTENAAATHYKLDLAKLWIEWTWYGKRMRWTATFWETKAPWNIAAMSPDFRTRFGAKRWARRWLAGRVADIKGRRVAEVSAASSASHDDLAEDFVARALGGEPWECRDNYPHPDGVAVSWVERGAGDTCERFIETPLPYEEACRIERLLEVARGHQ